MVEHPVQHHPQARGVEGVADGLEILVGPQAAVHLEIVPGVVAVAVAFEEGVEEDGVRPQGLDMIDPVQNPENSVLPDAVVLSGRAAQAQRVDLIDNRVVKPHSFSPF